MSLTLIRRFLSLAAIVLLAGCLRETSTNVRHSDFDLEAASRSDVERSSAVLHQWLADNGFKKLSGPQEIKAVTMWSGNPAEFTEVYTKPISPRFPQSLFIVTVLDNEPVKFFRITLTSAVAGTRAEHARQESLVRAEEEKFQDGLRGALPGKKP